MRRDRTPPVDATRRRREPPRVAWLHASIRAAALAVVAWGGGDLSAQADPADRAPACGALAAEGAEAAVPPAASGADPASKPPVLDALVGRWEGSGELFGSDASFTMSWAPVLGGRFLELRYEIEGAVRMSARAHYRVDGGRELRGVWIDTRGEFLDLDATASDSSLVTTWASPSETGRTVYRVTAPDALEVCDYVRAGDGWRAFGAARYDRAG